MIDRFLDPVDAGRALTTLRKLSRHHPSGWVLAGGLAVEIHSLRGGAAPATRPLNDIDFLVAAFDCIPETLGGDFLFRHVHPLDPPGKTLMQLVDAETALRVDLFRTNKATMRRASSVEFPFDPIPLVSREDILARTARLLLDLGKGVLVPAKHANDYLRLVKLIRPSAVEAAWPDHRRPDHPATFHEANWLVQGWIESRREALIIPEYSNDIDQVCPRCIATDAFPLADPRLVLSLLGYC